MHLELGEGSSSITGRGTIELIVQVQGAPHEIKLLNVYFVKKFKLYKTNSKVCSLYGKLEDGLYRIQGPVKYRQSNNSNLNKSGTRATEPSPTGKPENYSVSVNMWHQRFGHMYTKGDSPFETSVGRNIFAPSPSDTSDTDDEDTTPPRPRLTPTRPPPPIPAPAVQRFPTQDIPPFVSTRKKEVPVSTTSVKPTRVAYRAPVPNKPGWEREKVQRQSGATKGQWDVYYYAPELRTALRSRPDVKAYCETNLKVKYKADEYDFNPTHAVDSDSDDDVEQPRDAEVEPEVDNGEAETYSVRVYCKSHLPMRRLCRHLRVTSGRQLWPKN
uniref:MBD domain-containing protein n=1 Tax=Strigamia maritima TaxID=126957 RepID=T1IZ53_STRMM